MPSRGERVDQLVDRALCADVDATRRLVGDEDAGRAGTATWRRAPSAGCRRTASSPWRVRAASHARPRAASARRRRDARAAWSTTPPSLTCAEMRAASRCRRSSAASAAPASCDPPAASRRPAPIASRGDRIRTALAVDLDRAAGSRWSAPKIARATSERPLPIRPASPRISPARTSNETRSSNAGRAREVRGRRGRPAHRPPRRDLLRERKLQRAAEHRRDEPLGRLLGGGRGPHELARRAAP